MDTMSKRRSVLRALAAAAAAALLAWPLLAAAHAGRATQEAPGKAIFTGKGTCFACHGPDAKGTVLAPDLTDGEWLNFPERPDPARMKALVKTGVPKPKKHPGLMLPMGGASLSDQELDQVVAYVLGLSADG